jgi:hypothetical protein
MDSMKLTGVAIFGLLAYELSKTRFNSVTLTGGVDGDYNTGDVSGSLSSLGEAFTTSDEVNTGSSTSTETPSRGGSGSFEMGNKVTCRDEDCPPNHSATTQTDGMGDQLCQCVPNMAPAPTPNKKGFFEWLFGG